nr:MAG TPA: hypothetical protein [Caudoviricetes sp.]
MSLASVIIWRAIVQRAVKGKGSFFNKYITPKTQK